MKRIAIIGSGGAGKSTLARRLGKTLDIPVVHLDALHWQPGWEPTPKNEWLAIEHELVKPDAWIIDGNYGSSMDIRLLAADTVIFLDLHPAVCL